MLQVWEMVLEDGIGSMLYTQILLASVVVHCELSTYKDQKT